MSKKFSLDKILGDWYLLQLKTNCWSIAKRNLNHQGFKTFLPLQSFTSKRGSKFLTREKPLFPGYMFVGIKPDGAPWQKINSTLGVSRLICEGGSQRRFLLK